MKGWRKKLCAGLLLILLLIQPLPVRAEETTHLQASDDRTQAEDTDRITDELIGELELDEVERFLSQQTEDNLDISFGDLIKVFLSGEENFDVSRVWSWIVSHCFSAVRQNKTYLAQMLVLLLAFAMLQGISGIFADSFLSDISFLAVYFLFLYNALRIFASMQQIVYSCMDRIAEFTLLVQPVFCMAMIFSTGVNSASLTYEMLLLVLYLVQNLLQKLLLPLVFVFLITQFANFAWKEEHFSSLAKLLEIDAFFLNEDRHANNIALLYNSRSGEYRLCPFFDMGLSLFADTFDSFPLSDKFETKK